MQLISLFKAEVRCFLHIQEEIWIVQFVKL